jgi:methylated-DNA-[protein]-cysteine S-methyltransferase
MYLSIMDTEAGELSVVADETGVVWAAGFGSTDALLARLAKLGGPAPEPRADLGRVTSALRAYFDGDLAAIDDLPVTQRGGPFLELGWKLLREIPAGETITYTELASRAGSPTAVRAAGQACARNLIAPIVPCHRVLRTDGTLGGYAYGLPVKQWLLDHERGTAQTRLGA